MSTQQGVLGGAFNPGADYNLTGNITLKSGATLTADSGATITNNGTNALGAATATSINKVAITAPASSATLTLVDGTVVTGPAATGTLVTAAGTATLTGKTLTGAINTDYKVLAAPASYSATVTPATITGFSWTVVPGTYVFAVNLPATMTTVGGLTISFVLTTAALTSIQYQTYASTASDNTTGVSTTGTTTTSTTKVFDSKTAAYTGVQIRGSMVVGTGGTFEWDGCQNTSAGAGDVTTLLTGAFAQMTRVA